MAIVDVRDIRVVEGARFQSNPATFTLFLEEPATAPVTVTYFFQGDTASEGTGDLSESSRTVTIPAGSSSVTVSTNITGDDVIEGVETFKLVVMARANAELPDGAAALIATATIYDDDDPNVGNPGAAEGDLAERVMGPEPVAGVLPTLDAMGIFVNEGDIGTDPARFLVTLDRPATARVTFDYHLQSVSASDASSDYDDRRGTVTLNAGEQATWVGVNVDGDTRIEGDETFQVVLTNPTNAVFKENAAALVATATILDSDDTVENVRTGFGDPAETIFGPYSEPGDNPTVRINNVSVVEGDSSSEPARLLITLDRPAVANVTFNYSVNNGDATEALGDYDQLNSRGTINAGSISTYLSINAFGDNEIEADETFSVTLTNLKNAKFEDDAALLHATVTILDDDGGPVTTLTGIGEQARGVNGPTEANDIRMSVVNTSIIEGNSGSDIAYVYFLLSEPVPTRMTVQYQTVAQTATSGEDYSNTSLRTLVLEEGQRSGYVAITIVGDNDIEGDESLALRFVNPSAGLVFATGGATMDASIVIKDNDTGTITDAANTGPEFEFIEFTPGATQGDDTITGDDQGNVLSARAGNDVVYGGGLGDLIDGGLGNDQLFGEDGNDWITPGEGSDTVDGGDGRDMVSFVTVRDTPGRPNTQYRLTLDLETGVATTSGDDVYTLRNVERVTGTVNADYMRGDAGDNELRGSGDYDWFVATTGNDTIDGGQGNDMISFLEWSNTNIASASTFDTGAPLVGAAVTGVIVDLSDDANNTNLAAGQTLLSVERVTGSSREDVFYGDNNENDFRGAGGYDWFVGSTGGRERYFGGTGVDTVTYFNSTSGVEASLRNGAQVGGEETGRGSKGDAARDLYFEIENLVGTNFNDSLTGNSGRNELNGLDGDDFLFGFAGIDRLKGGLGDDTIDGGGGTDYALFDGNASDYMLDRIAAKTVLVTGASGNDRVVDVEWFRFDDQDIYVADIL